MAAAAAPVAEEVEEVFEADYGVSEEDPSIVQVEEDPSNVPVDEESEVTALDEAVLHGS